MGEVKDEDFCIIDHCLVIRLPAEVDHYGAGYICRQADKMICNDDVCNVIFDFENTRFMDSSGIGILMGRQKRISVFGGKVYAIHADKQMKRILQVSGIDKYVEVLES